MTLLYGYSEAEERMKREDDKPNLMVSIDHDFYTNNHAAAKRKEQEVAYSKKDRDGYSLGKFERKESKNEYAMGGQIKERRGFYTSKKRSR